MHNLFKVEFVEAEYLPEDNRCGKGPGIYVFIEYEYRELMFFVNQQVLKFYDKSTIDADLFARFKLDAELKKICFIFDEDNNWLNFNQK